jgi:hypothetical protein
MRMGREIHRSTRLVHALPSVLVVLALVVPGCLSDEREKGPLDLKVTKYDVVDPRNVTIGLAFHNTGPDRLTRIYASIRASYSPVNGLGGHGGAVVLDERGRYDNHLGIFNDSDVILPGAWWNVTQHVYFPPRQSEVVKGDIFRISVSARYDDGLTEWAWDYFLPCRDTHTGERVYLNRWTGERVPAGAPDAFCGDNWGLYYPHKISHDGR